MDGHDLPKDLRKLGYSGASVGDGLVILFDGRDSSRPGDAVAVILDGEDPSDLLRKSGYAVGNSRFPEIKVLTLMTRQTEQDQMRRQ